MSGARSGSFAMVRRTGLPEAVASFIVTVLAAEAALAGPAED